MAKRKQTARPPALTSAPAVKPSNSPALPLRISFGALCALLVAAPYYLSGFWPASLDIMAGEAHLPLAIFLSLTACICLLMALTGNGNQVPHDRPLPHSGNLVAWLLAAFFIWSCFAALTTVHLHDTLLELSRIGGCLAWFFIARHLLNAPGHDARAARRLWVFSAVVAGAVLVAGVAVVSYIQTRQAQFSTFYNPNLFANYCAMAIPVALGWAILVARTVGAQRPGTSLPVVLLPALLPALIIALGLLSSSSKGGLLSFLIGVAVFFGAAWRAQSQRIITLLRANLVVVSIAALLLLLGGGLVFSKTVLPRLQEASSLRDHSTMFRVYVWRSTVDMAQARPVSGWGPGSFPSVFSQFAIAGYTRSAHQLWLQLAAENGFPALLLLAATCLSAMAAFWRALRSQSWPVAAAGLGAMAAFSVHGLTDAGWSMTSIVLLLMVLLGLSANLDNQPESDVPMQTGLNWRWLAAALVIALTAAGVQRAVRGEDLRAEAIARAKASAPQTAMELAREATTADPLSSRVWMNLALFQAANNEDATATFEKAIELQPTRPASYLSLAEYLAQLKPLGREAERYFDRAVALDPNNSSIRLVRARWRLERNDARGWDDLEFVAKLADEPYGKYPATPQFVNLDFAQAYTQLVPRLLKKGDGASRDRARAMIKRGLDDVQRANYYKAEQEKYQQLMESSGIATANQELETVASRLNELATEIANAAKTREKPK